MNDAGRPEPVQALAEDDPTSVAGYGLAGRLGSGGMGRVYLSHTPGGRPVAVKVIRPELSGDPAFRHRFRQEVLAAERVHGLFTAPVIDSDTESATPWLVTAYVSGPSLADAVARHGALPVESTLLMVAGIAEALQSIHGAGIVHRDLKPSNVLLAADGPRVIDFGIARAVDATALTGSGFMIGTPSYMSPEQATGGPVDGATDVFALGQIAAFAVTGSSAFGEGSGHAVLYRVVHETPDLSGVPGPLRDLVTRCLAKNPADRPGLDEVIGACRSAATSRELRRPEDWLPAGVAADVAVQGGAVQGGAVRTEAAPAGAAQDAAAYGLRTPTGPSGPPVHPGPPSPPAQPVLPGQAVPPGPGGGPGPYAVVAGEPATTPDRSAGTLRRRILPVIAVCAALAGAGAIGYVLAPEGSSGRAKDSASPSGEPSGNGSRSPGQPVPEPAVYEAVELPKNDHLYFGAEPVRPTHSGSWNKDRIDFRYHSDRLRTREGNRMVLLTPAQKGSLPLCKRQSRFTGNINVSEVPPGSQICVFTREGNVALVSVRGLVPGKHTVVDVRLWRDAGGPAAAP